MGRYMTQEVKQMNVPVVFLDPECLALAYIDKNKELVRSYVEKALVLSNFARKEWLMFACNTGGHWIAVVMSIKFSIVRYLDSISDYEYDVSILTGVLDEAFSRFMQGDSKRKKGRIELQHLTKFPCHQQLGGLACGFYAAYHILNAASAVASMQNVEDFSVPTEPLDQAVLSDLRDQMANFLMSEVISTKGEFHCHSGTY